MNFWVTYIHECYLSGILRVVQSTGEVDTGLVEPVLLTGATSCAVCHLMGWSVQ